VSGGFAVDLAAVEAAADRLAGHVVRTPTLVSETLSAIHGCELVCKFENQQYTGAFKERGARNCLAQLDPARRARGVVAVSAGNHAQAVAHHARDLGIGATIVMPRHTPAVKIVGTERLGAEIVLAGDTVDDGMAHAHRLVDEAGLTFVHPFDDPRVIAGQGTIALEWLADAPELDTLVVPIGGGGLIAGIAVAAKALRPDLRIVGVEAALFPSVQRLRRGLPPPDGGATIADGIAVKHPGALTLPVIDALVDELILVEEAALEAAILELLEIEKTVVEGAGAAGLAAVATAPERFRGRRVGLLLCGGNIDPRLLSGVILRGLVTTSRLVRLVVAVPDRPGSLAEIAAIIADENANIVDVQHRREFSGLSVMRTEVGVTLATRDAEHVDRITAALENHGVAVRTLARDQV
jgi:threonine dehydratase